MRKLSSATILSVLLAVSWFGCFASKPRAVEPSAPIQWAYDRVKGEEYLEVKGREGWEAYAAFLSSDGYTVYLLKKHL